MSVVRDTFSTERKFSKNGETNDHIPYNKISNFDTEDPHLLLKLILDINHDDIYQGLKNLFSSFLFFKRLKNLFPLFS